MQNPTPHGLTEQRVNFDKSKGVEPQVEVIAGSEITASGTENLGQVAAKLKNTAAEMIELINDMEKRKDWKANPLLSKLGVIITYIDRI